MIDIKELTQQEQIDLVVNLLHSIPGPQRILDDQLALKEGVEYAYLPVGGRHVLIPAHSTEVVTATCFSAFKPSRFIILEPRIICSLCKTDHKIARDQWSISDIFVGSKAQILNSSWIEGVVFGPDNVSPFDWTTCRPGISISMNVHNNRDIPAPFCGVLFGYTVKTADVREG